MLREHPTDGEIYEPKTIQTAYNVTAEGIYGILFALGIKRKEIVWLNVSKSGFYPVAGEDKLDFIYKYLTITDAINVYKLFEIAGATFVDDPSKAKYVVSDEVESVREDQVLIRSYDYTPLIPLINGKF
jgi:RNA-binding protein YlmH